MGKRIDDLAENAGCIGWGLFPVWLVSLPFLFEASIALVIIITVVYTGVIAYLGIVGHRIKKQREQEAEIKRAEFYKNQAKAEAEEEGRRLSQGKIRAARLRKCAEQHRKELASLRIRLLVKDEFGHIDTQPWREKVMYFVEKVANVDLGKESFTDKEILPGGGRYKTIHVETFILHPDTAFKIVDEIAKEAQKEIENREYRPNMTGVEYEELCGETLKSAGWEVQFTKTTGDQGVDLLAKKDGVTAAIQCKRFAKQVGNKAVQEVIAGKSFYNADKAVVVAPNGFTPSAQDLAAASDVVLTDHNLLRELSF